MNDSIVRQDLVDIEASAMELADRMPVLVVEARKVSHTVFHGIHGRKRAGSGDTFWQFRKYSHGDTAAQIDWRRSASSQGLYVREKEWEAAHTVWLWPDLSPSMTFKSHMSDIQKRERALVLMFALGQLLVNAGERVGIPGLSYPNASRSIISKLAETVISEVQSRPDAEPLPPDIKFHALSECVIFSDCFEPVETLIERCRKIASQGVRGHVVQILDPAEESFPYSGRTEFRSHTGSSRFIISRAERIKEDYQLRLEALKAELKNHFDRMNWSYMVHHTDSSASDALLSLYSMVAGSADHLSGVVSFGKSEPGTGYQGGGSL